jgi:hypothetical protein
MPQWKEKNLSVPSSSTEDALVDGASSVEDVSAAADTWGVLLLLDAKSNYPLLGTSDPGRRSGSMSSPRVKAIINKYGYHGGAFLKMCDPAAKDNSVICSEAIFEFIGSVLKKDKTGGSPLICYARANYKCIKGTVPSFPSPRDIDSMIAAKGVEQTGRMVHSRLNQYFGGLSKNSVSNALPKREAEPRIEWYGYSNIFYYRKY